ncbi:enoyl-CoA hydratase-related protein [Pseudomaricurvus hydrocarbonicus]
MFNDPDNFNALDEFSCKAFSEAATWLSLQSSVRVVLLRAKGKAFSVGGSIAAFSSAGSNADALLGAMTTHFHTAVSRLMRMDAPVIAVVNGICGGGGASLTCVADLTLAAESSKITFAYTLSAISPDGGATYALPRIVGMRKAYELLVLNPTLTAADAKELGIVTEVVEDDQLDDVAMKWANRLSNGPTKAYGAVKALLHDSLANSPEAQMQNEGISIARLAVAEDGQEGIDAFLKKRKPEFKGR